MKPSAAQLLLIVVVGLFSGLLIWASSFQVDQVVRADAKVVPVKDVVKVQNRFSGAVQETLVNLGDSVKQGDMLFRIDPEDTETDVTQTRLALLTQATIAARLNAQISRSDPRYPEDSPADIIATQNLVLASKRSELASRARLVESKIDALNHEISETQAISIAAGRQAKLAHEEVALLEPLVNMGAEPKLRLIEVKRTLNDLSERIEVGALRVKRLQSDLETQRRILKQESERYILEAHEQLAEVQAQLSRIRGELERAGDRRAKSEITSPIDGVVTAIPFGVVGQIAESGTVLAEIVPSDTSYKVKAQIKPMDVRYVMIGQDARLSLIAYDFADYGHIDVKVSEVAQNLTEPAQAEPYYSAELTITSSVFSKSGKPAVLMPGLIGQIDILGEPITVLDYVTKPITRVGSRALTEQ